MTPCEAHNKSDKTCSCYCQGCGNLHRDCSCNLLKGVLLDDEG